METPLASAGPAPPRWNPWPVCIIAWFTLAILGCATFIFFCNRHPADLVAPDYYEQEVRYQGQIERIQHARQRARLASVTYDPSQKLIRVALPPSQALGHATGSIQLYRPSAMDQDRQFALQPDRDGVQNLDAANLRPGLWEVRVSWTVGGQDYFIDQRVVITPPNPHSSQPKVGAALPRQRSAGFQPAVSPTSSRQAVPAWSHRRIGNPRYSRLEVCATPSCWRNQ